MERKKANSAAASSATEHATGPYRDAWQWNAVTWGTHCVDCYPGNCAFRVYAQDGQIAREEQAGTYQTIEPGVPDMNPMGCQKGAAWSLRRNAPDRILYPMRRVGPRGSGGWQRISWDEALTEIADSILDAIAEVGPGSILHETTPAQGGLTAVVAAARFNQLLSGTTLDLEGMINDFNIGQYMTFGKWAVSSADDWFHSDLIFIWHMNPVYTRIPFCHFIAEARYRGAEIVTIAPDFSPSAVHADKHVPVTPGGDAALALAMCQTIIEEGLFDAQFVREQTDLALLVRRDDGRFLRESDLQDGGRDDQFYVLDGGGGGVTAAPRGTLDLGDVKPLLEGETEIQLANGTTVKVTPVFALLRSHLEEWTPEKATSYCGVAPSLIRYLARRAAACRTNILTGFNVCKYYHGDLMERSLCLLLALTGNWGKKGTGIRSWSPGALDGVLLFGAKRMFGAEGDAASILAQLRSAIQTIRETQDAPTDEIAAIKLATDWVPPVGNIPSSFFLYYQAGFDKRWNSPDWHDPTMGDVFATRFGEALRKWWEPLAARVRDVPPRVLIEVGGNILRRTRGGQNMLLANLWPKLKMVATVDIRMTTTAMQSDILLPAADHYEKVNLTYTTPHVLQFHIADKAAEPPGETKPDWEIFALLARKLQERAVARGPAEYVDHEGKTRRLQNLYEDFTDGCPDTEQLVDGWIRDSAVAGNVPAGTSLASLRKDGHVRLTNWGMSGYGFAQASDLRPDETHSPYRWHVEKKLPYPTLTRRAQFYIDHPWFMEMGEALPVHKDNPQMGGAYPLVLTSGHNRWSIHSQNIADRVLLQTHRGVPHVSINPQDAADRGIENGDDVRMYNDIGEVILQAKVAACVQPGQVICYNGWEPYMFPGWSDPANVEPGMVKPLHLAAGYGHLTYRVGAWQIVTVDRGTRVEVAPVR
jgi:DMSO reductase family type II enzyme molybdopterin subunit